MTLGVGAIGLGGLFAAYTYVASTLLEVTHGSNQFVTLVLCMFGLGMTAGSCYLRTRVVALLATTA